MTATASAGMSRLMREMLASAATHARAPLVAARRAHLRLRPRRLRHARRVAAVAGAHAGLRAEPPGRRVHRAVGLVLQASDSYGAAWTVFAALCGVVALVVTVSAPRSIASARRRSRAEDAVFSRPWPTASRSPPRSA